MRERELRHYVFVLLWENEKFREIKQEKVWKFWKFAHLIINLLSKNFVKATFSPKVTKYS